MQTSTARVYHGGGRRWFTLGAACHNEAKRMVLTRHFDGEWLPYPEDDYPTALIARVARILMYQHRKANP